MSFYLCFDRGRDAHWIEEAGEFSPNTRAYTLVVDEFDSEEDALDALAACEAAKGCFEDWVEGVILPQATEVIDRM